MLRSVVAVVPALLALSACLEPARLNSRCEWAGDGGTGAIDTRDAAGRRHLATDVRIAGEVAVRTGDSAMTRVGIPGAERIRFECLDRLHATIRDRHAVNQTDIDAAVYARDFWIDTSTIYLPMGALFFLVSAWLSRRVFRRLPPAGERWTTALMIAWVGVSASVIATMLARLHAWNVDAVRLRNFHMSFRAAYIPISTHRWLALTIALLIFIVAAWREFQHAAKRPASDGASRFLDGWQR